MKFTESLAGETILFDGAMGTELLKLGLPQGSCLEILNLTRPDAVRAVHAASVEAGSRVLRTNTLGGGRLALTTAGQETRLEAINRAGVRLALEAAGEREATFVAGSIGPAGDPATTPNRVAREAYQEQAGILEGAGVHLLVLETHTDVGQLLAGIAAVRDAGRLPVVALLAFPDPDRTSDGVSPADAARALAESGAAAVGMNCGTGPEDTLRLARTMTEAGAPRLVLLPSAGLPVPRPDGTLSFPAGPEAFAAFARSAQDLRPGGMGGCCGTTPDHIRAMAAELYG